MTVPEGWNFAALGDLFTWSSGARPNYSDDGDFRVYGSNGQLGFSDDWNVEDAFLVGRVGASGSLHSIPGKAWASDNTLIAVPTSTSASFGFLGYLLHFMDLPSHATQTAQPLLTQKILKPLGCALPPLPEQRKIATILSSVDDAIAATEAVIEQTRKVKQGLLQELLTNGPRRSPGKPVEGWITGRIPELDLIPEHWEVVPISQLARLESGHTPDRKRPEYWNAGIGWLSLHDTKRLDEHVVSSTELTISEAGLANSSARLLPVGTVALSRTATVGKCVILGDEMATSQDFACYVCGPKLDNRYLMHLFRYMGHVWAYLSGGSTHKTVYMPIFRKLQILLPPLNEQVEIAQAADDLDSAMAAARREHGQLQALKAGLLQDLLTGKVRVNP